MVASKVEPTEYQKSILDKLDEKASTKGQEEGKRRKKKGPKGPNPLSVKKSTKKRDGGKSSSASSGGITKSKVLWGTRRLWT